MVPVLDNWCARLGFDVAKLAMPLAFTAQLGGCLTLMGDAMNFAAQNIYSSAGYSISFFEFTPVAAPLLGFGILYFAIVSPLLLGQQIHDQETGDTISQTHSRCEIDDYFRVGFVVNSSGAFSRGSMKLEQAGFSRFEGVFRIKMVVRNGEQVWGSDFHGHEDYRLTAGDVIIFCASAEGIVALRKTGGISLTTELESERLGYGRSERALFEIELPATSTLLGSPLDTSLLRSEHHCALLAVRARPSAEEVKLAKEAACRLSHRTPHSRWSQASPGSGAACPVVRVSSTSSPSATVPTTTMKSFEGFLLKEGDVLLIEAAPSVVASPPWARDFGIVRSIPKSTPPRLGRKRDMLRSLGAIVGAAMAIGIFIGSSMKPELVNFTLTCNLIILVLFLLLTRTLSLTDVFQSMDFSVLLTMVGAFPLGEAIQAVGLHLWAGKALAGLFASLGKFGTFLSVYLVCGILTNLINNIAVLAMFAPVSVQLAHMQGVSLRGIVVCTTLASAAVFTIPIGHQTNVMVTPLGKYAWKDFWKFGASFQILHGILCCVLCMYMF